MILGSSNFIRQALNLLGGKRFTDDEEVETEVAETTVKRFLCAGFDALIKRRHKCINVGGGYAEK
jgi:hypothetical protein